MQVDTALRSKPVYRYRRILDIFLMLANSACASLEYGMPEQTPYELSGQGTTTIVFEAGLGDGKGSWEKLIQKLGPQYRTFAYDRPGYSGPLGGPKKMPGDEDGRRTGAEIAQHLDRVLTAAGVEPPYVLVGHSIGGLYSLSYALLFPENVAEVVLVDARMPDFNDECKAKGLGTCEAPGWAKLIMPEHQLAEVEGEADTRRFTRDAEAYGALPITLIVATEPQALASKKFQLVWRSVAQAFAEKLQNGRRIEAQGASHYIHHQQTDLVAREISRAVDGARR